MKRFRDNQGQVLLIVVLVGMIALFITLGIVARVSRLSKEVGEVQIHEAAFSISEKYARQILDLAKDGDSPDGIVAQVLAGVHTEDNVKVSWEGSTYLPGITLVDNETFEFVPDGAGIVSITPANWTTTSLLLTVVSYNGAEYSVKKTLFAGCNSASGDLGATCNDGIISYSATANDRAIRIRSVNGPIQLTINSGAGAISIKYIITATETEEGDEGGIQSETTVFVPKSKVMPTLFDYVLFNGQGQVVK